MAKQLRDARYWLDKAEETRSIGETMRNAEARRVMLEIATQYAEMAVRARASAPEPGDDRTAS